MSALNAFDLTAEEAQQRSQRVREYVMTRMPGFFKEARKFEGRRFVDPRGGLAPYNPYSGMITARS